MLCNNRSVILTFFFGLFVLLNEDERKILSNFPLVGIIIRKIYK